MIYSQLSNIKSIYIKFVIFHICRKKESSENIRMYGLAGEEDTLN